MMPRHRKERRPRYAGLRRVISSRRGVLPRVTVFGPASGREAGRSLAPPAPRPRVRLARSLLATPWFAAGAGIVIAAALAVDSPTALTYGPPDPGERCPVQGCGTQPPPAQPATASPGVALKAPGLQMKGGETAPGRQHRRADHDDFLLGYQIVRRWSWGFVAVITIPGDVRPGGWNLRLAFPAAHVDRVWGARWRPSGDGNGGTADGPVPGPATPPGPAGLALTR